MTIDPEVLRQDMEALAADPARVVPFVAAYGDRLAHVARHHLGELGRRDLAGDRDELQGLVWEIALVIQDNAAGWRPGGALPWTWAYRAIRSHVAAAIGHARAETDVDDLPDRAAPPAIPAAEVDFDALADGHTALGLLRQALGEVRATDVQRRVHLEYRLQKAMGDPSPSKTVGALFDLSPANVRQIDRRVRTALTEVVVADPRYRPLRAIPWLDVDVEGRAA